MNNVEEVWRLCEESDEGESKVRKQELGDMK